MSRHVELPKRLADAIKRTWPDGVVEMMDLEEETSVHKACSKLQTRLSRLPGSNLVFERAAGGGPRCRSGRRSTRMDRTDLLLPPLFPLPIGQRPETVKYTTVRHNLSISAEGPITPWQALGR
jgi:hypothetical protein